VLGSLIAISIVVCTHQSSDSKVDESVIHGGALHVLTTVAGGREGSALADIPVAAAVEMRSFPATHMHAIPLSPVATPAKHLPPIPAGKDTCSAAVSSGVAAVLQFEDQVATSSRCNRVLETSVAGLKSGEKGLSQVKTQSHFRQSARGTSVNAARLLYGMEVKQHMLLRTEASSACHLTFASSNFRVLYGRAKEAAAPRDATELLMAAKMLVQAHAARHNIRESVCKHYYQTLHTEAFKHHKSLKNDLGAAAEYLWTSPLRLRNMEFCSILNAAIRRDEHAELIHAIVIIRGINMRRVGNRESMERKSRFPKGGICWRGGGFDDACRGFFTHGKRFRIPGFLATSFHLKTAKGFCARAARNGPCILWQIKMNPLGATDPMLRCRHVNYVRKTHVKGECEYLFAPFSVFTVGAAKWASVRGEAHAVTLHAALDNKREPEDLPLAPWY